MLASGQADCRGTGTHACLGMTPPLCRPPSCSVLPLHFHLPYPPPHAGGGEGVGAGAGEQRRDVGYGTEADKNVVVATRDVMRAT